MIHPVTQPEARVWALLYVRRAAGRDYTSADADREAFMGMSGPGEAGYNISRGRITVPATGERKWTFRFADLEREINTPAPALAGGEQLTFGF
jgi:hypothetical protein